jgi:Putative Actinobacterial Holin-X, holin superfamily III
MTDPMDRQFTSPRPASTPVDVENTSVGELMGNVSRDLFTLLRQEIALAKAEVKGEAKKTGKAVGMLGGAGFAGYLVLLFLSLALWWGLANTMDQGWAALIVAGLWTVIGVVLYSAGRTEMRKVNPKPERTVDTVKQVPQALNPHEETT